MKHKSKKSSKGAAATVSADRLAGLMNNPGFARRNPQVAALLAGIGATGFQVTPALAEIIEHEVPRKKVSRGEQEMELILQAMLRRGEIKSYGHEDITLRVGTDRCRYTPDFHVVLLDDRVRLIEIKGRQKWEDSLVKFKAAKKQFPCFEFEMWERSADYGWRKMY